MKSIYSCGSTKRNIKYIKVSSLRVEVSESKQILKDRIRIWYLMQNFAVAISVTISTMQTDSIKDISYIVLM